MAEESLGTAAIYLTVDSTKMEAGVARAKAKLAGMGDEATKQYSRMNASEKRRAESLVRQIDLLGKTRSEQIAYNAKLKVGGALGDEIASKAAANAAKIERTAGATGGLTKAFSGSSKTARELQFAMRGLPAQLTDIFSSLATGQDPMRVFLQQGGQLKDMFGGIRPAARALGSSLLKLVNPYTVAAVAAGALLFAWKQGIDEIEAYNAALIKTGNYAGLTAKQLDDMAASMDAVRGTQHAAAAAIAQTVQAGVFIGDQIRDVASAVETAGKDADKMVQEFAKLADDPVNAIVELNEHQHFLTAAVYDQIKALQDQGREQEAASLAIKTYSDTVVNRTDDIKENLDNVSQAWGGVKKAAGEAWDAMIHGTRDSANSTIQSIKDWWSGLHTLAAFIEHPKQAAFQVAFAPRTRAGNDRDEVRAAQEQQANETLIAFRKRTGEFRTAEEKRVADIVKIIGEANAAIGKANAAGNKALATKIARQEEALIQAIQAQGKDAGAGPGGGSGGGGHGGKAFDAERFHQHAVDEIRKEIEAQGKLNDAKARADAQADQFVANLEAELRTKQAILDLDVKSVGMGQQEAARMRELLAIRQDFDRKMARLDRDYANHPERADAYKRERDALKANYEAELAMTKEHYARMDEARGNWLNGLASGLQDVVDAGENTAGMMHDTVVDAFGNMTDAIVEFVQTGKLNLKDLADAFIADLVRMEVQAAASQVFASAVQGLSFNFMGGLAKGGAFDQSGVIPFARGGVIDSPHLFKFAHGTGLMGEAGPEAIMPLKRGPDGKLGVVARGGGGGGDVIVNIENHSGQQTTTKRSTDGNGNDVITVLIGAAVGEVNKQIARNGSVGQTIANTFGLARRGVPVAG